MTGNRKRDWQTPELDSLDRELDAALAKYAVAEPRTGLEERILANLQTERDHAHERARWRWGAAALAIAAVVLVIIGLSWTGMRRIPTTAGHPLPPKPRVHLAPPQIASTQPPAPDSRPRRFARPSHPSATAMPKLDQFPSPRPLSDQERILASYVEAYPDRAVLLARARTEALRRDRIEETQSFPLDDWATDSEDRNSDTSER
jgi:hypothetical protein